jgi:hypothetical protein
MTEYLLIVIDYRGCHLLFITVYHANRTEQPILAHIRHQCRKAIVLNAIEMCLINSGVEKMNNI